MIISKFLSDAKNDLIEQIEQFYKTNDYMRFFYRRKITSIVNHLGGYQVLFPFLRYILNVTDDNNEIIEGEKANPHSLKDFINNFNIYYSETFKNICDYIVTL